MTEEKHREMLDGKEEVARRTCWKLEVGPLSLRCLRGEGAMFQVQARIDGRWEDCRNMSGTDPYVLLLRTVSTKYMGGVVRSHLDS